jgi:hypothetical protein
VCRQEYILTSSLWKFLGWQLSRARQGRLRFHRQTIEDSIAGMVQKMRPEHHIGPLRPVMRPADLIT